MKEGILPPSMGLTQKLNVPEWSHRDTVNKPPVLLPSGIKGKVAMPTNTFSTPAIEGHGVIPTKKELLDRNKERRASWGAQVRRNSIHSVNITPTEKPKDGNYKSSPEAHIRKHHVDGHSITNRKQSENTDIHSVREEPVPVPLNLRVEAKKKKRRSIGPRSQTHAASAIALPGIPGTDPLTGIPDSTGSSGPSSLRSSPVDSPAGSPRDSTSTIDLQWKDRDRSKRKSWNRRVSMGKPGRSVSPNIISAKPSSSPSSPVQPMLDPTKPRTSSPLVINTKLLPAVLSHMSHPEPPIPTTPEPKPRPERNTPIMVPPIAVPALHGVTVTKITNRPRSPRGGKIAISVKKTSAHHPTKAILSQINPTNERTLRMKRRETYQKLARVQGPPQAAGKALQNESSAILKSHFDEQAKNQRKYDKDLQNLQKSSKAEIAATEKGWTDEVKIKTKRFNLNIANEKKVFDMQLQGLETKHQVSMELWKEQNQALQISKPEEFNAKILMEKKKQLEYKKILVQGRKHDIHSLQMTFLEEQHALEKEKLEKVQSLEMYEIERKAATLRRQLQDTCALQIQQHNDRIILLRKKNSEVVKDKRTKQKEKQDKLLESDLEATKNDMLNHQKQEKSNLEISLKSEQKKLEDTHACQRELLELKHQKALQRQKGNQEREQLETRFLFGKLNRLLELGHDTYGPHDHEPVDAVLEQIEEDKCLLLKALEADTEKAISKIKAKIVEAKKRECSDG